MHSFQAGDEVLVLLPSETSKMTAQWKGSYCVIQKVNYVKYNVGERSGIVTYHINILSTNVKLCFLAGTLDTGTDIDTINVFATEDEESILDIKIVQLLTKTQKTRYLGHS